MFFWNKDKQDLEFLMRRVDIQASIIEKMDTDMSKMRVTIGNILISQQNLRDKVGVFEHRLNIQSKRIEALETAAHGLKKDGTPRAKPGRKAL